MPLCNRLTTTPAAKLAPALRVGPEKTPLGVARRLFGTTKLRSLRLDWGFFRTNSGDPYSVYRP